MKKQMRLRPSRSRRKRTFAAFIGLGFIIGIGWWMPLTAGYATTTPMLLNRIRPTVSMYPVVGFSGYFGKNDWVPVTLSIHNPGNAAQADLTLQMNNILPNNKMANGSMDWPIYLPQDGWVSEQIYVPGFVINGSTAVVCTIGGQVVGTAYLNGNPVGNVAIVAVLSSETQTAQFLTGSSDGAEPVLPVSVNPTKFPTTANLLNALSAVVATPEILRSLSSEQQFALLTWVKLGGMLLVTGTEQDTSFWTRYLPITYGRSQQATADGLDLFAGSSVPAPSGLTIEAGDITQNATLWASNGSSPMLASLPVGRGVVWQTSFSTSDPTLLGWSGNPTLWTSVLHQGTYQSQSALVPLLDPNGVLSFAAASDSLSPLRVPSLHVWAFVFVLYILVVGPGTFFVLRRFNRASWAWFILPVTSGLTTLGIYTFGVMERPPGLLNEGIGVLELVGDGTAESYGIQAFMSPYRGGLQFQFDQPMLAMPFTEQTVLPTGTASVVNASKTAISFMDASRWSVRYVYAAGALQGQGELEAQLASSFGMLLGTVKNNTPYPLHDVAMFWKGHMYELGDLPPWQTISVNQLTGEPSKSDNWASTYGAYNHELTRGIGRPLGTFAASNDWTSTMPDVDNVMFVATTSAKIPTLPNVSTPQDVASSTSMVLVRQFAPVTIYSGGPFS